MSDFLAGAGLLLAVGASAAAILLPAGRPRSAAMAMAMALFPVLIIGDQWHTAQIVDLRHDEWRIVVLLAIAVLAIGVLAIFFRPWPIAIPLAVIVALPFRVPLEAGGDTANLLVPLYLVIAAGVVAVGARDWGRRSAGPVSSTWLAKVLAAVVVLYALQTLYSEDFSKGLQNVCFFLVPFTVAFGLLQDVEWDGRLLRWALILVGIEASAFVVIGSVEFLTGSLYWNDQIIRSNEFHTYFRVNGVFWDPNVYGRYLALVTTVAAAALLWVRTRESFWLLSGLILVLWIGLVPTYSQSSFLALLAGLAMLAAIRWNWRWTLVVVAVCSVGAVLVVLLAGGSGKITSDRLNVDLSGRGSLISGGLDLFAERPVWGYGAGGFQSAYGEHRENPDAPVTISHTEPVTVAAEQGLIGLIAYLLLISVALRTMSAGLLNGNAARAAVLAAFVALLVHTLAYAGFFEDPITWVLLAVGASLAAAPAVRDPA
ncbi:MAG TPA: O-antigen ligase family protein [Solirubrobacterales bacterium]|nr:O-antigen ligase family protein [Solirubrobacterales bacterium]